MTHEEGRLHYEAGCYELYGSPLRSGDVLEVLTGSGWYGVAPGGLLACGYGRRGGRQRRGGTLDKQRRSTPHSCDAGLYV
jgi:hypothetical protein